LPFPLFVRAIYLSLQLRDSV